ncbi:MAG: hypothetical protein K1X83_07560 [Oligoflexia bacterium]|nr:hypothetical protein [Oligoflexia bacterium]
MVEAVTNNSSSTSVQAVKGSAALKSAGAKGSGFEALFKSLIIPDAADSLSEEELFAGVARDRIAALKGDEAASKYDDALESAKSRLKKPDGFVSFEEAGKAALIELRSAGVLSAEEADQVYSESFAASQLDDNKEALYDGRGGGADKTVATDAIDKALAAAQLYLEQLTGGSQKAPSRSLDEGTPNKAKSASPGGVAASNVSDATFKPEGTKFDGQNGFLFKPEASSDGKLAILAPESLLKIVDSVVLKDENGEEIETGRSISFGDDGSREKFSFNKAGGEYPKNLKVEVRLTNGKIWSYEIPDPSQRYD